MSPEWVSHLLAPSLCPDVFRRVSLLPRDPRLRLSGTEDKRSVPLFPLGPGAPGLHTHPGPVDTGGSHPQTCGLTTLVLRVAVTVLVGTELYQDRGVPGRYSGYDSRPPRQSVTDQGKVGFKSETFFWCIYEGKFPGVLRSS